ncbi:MAG: AraC family transcriptional regulator [Oscillospiraceae bacterium]|jgi:AraC-like DNA-binding protein|nr:AraC family transcriptional regulator [Oscillospiraceae bacterium]
MNWIEDTQKALNFIENNLLENIGADDVSKHINSSVDYFKRTFNIVTGLSISEYIRNRRLTLAGDELKNTQAKVIDISMKYNYDSPDSFTKAFARFHGVTPTAARVPSENLKHFYPLSIDIYIRGGFGIERKIIPNVPELVYYGSETDYAFSLLASIWSGAGDKAELSELAVYSGMANRFVWVPGSWSRGCECLGSIDETPYEDILRLLKTFGWEAKCVKVLRDNQGKPINTDNEQIRNDFVSTIDKGFPIISLGTKNHRYNAVIGYENGGSVIVCKEGIDTPDTPGGEKSSVTVTRDNWEDTISDYILLKEKNNVAPERVRFLDLLKLVVYRARRTDKIDSKTMRVSSANVGFAAWEAYLHMLEHEDLSKLSLEEIRKIDMFGQYCDGLCQIWGRNSGLEYYRAVAQRFPEWKSELEIAIDALDKCAKYGGFVWSLGFDSENFADKFRDSGVRKILADEGRKAMQKDIEAIEQFEKILSKE